MNINYLFEAFNKSNIDRFQDLIKLKSFSSQIVKLSFPTFNRYSLNTISNQFMVFTEHENPELLKIICEGSTKDLGLAPGYFMIIKIKLPDDFPVENNGFGFLVFTIFNQENMDIPETELCITYFGNMIINHVYPFSQNIINDNSPIFCFFLIAKPSKNCEGAIGFIDIGDNIPGNVFTGSSEVIRCVAVNLTD